MKGAVAGVDGGDVLGARRYRTHRAAPGSIPGAAAPCSLLPPATCADQPQHPPDSSRLCTGKTSPPHWKLTSGRCSTEKPCGEWLRCPVRGAARSRAVSNAPRLTISRTDSAGERRTAPWQAGGCCHRGLFQQLRQPLAKQHYPLTDTGVAGAGADKHGGCGALQARAGGGRRQ